jgi:hypothetical protein
LATNYIIWKNIELKNVKGIYTTNCQSIVLARKHFEKSLRRGGKRGVGFKK